MMDQIVNWLEKIIAEKRSEIAAVKSRAKQFRGLAEKRRDIRDFRGAIRRREGRVRLIAEAKKSSPSAGLIAAKYDPAQIARRYAEARADAISVLTEENYF